MAKSIDYLHAAEYIVPSMTNAAASGRIEAFLMGIDVNYINHRLDGQTPLMWVCDRLSDPLMVQRLLELGADVHMKDINGHTALMKSVKHGCGTRNQIEMLNLLLEAGSEISARDNRGLTALDHAKDRDNRCGPVVIGMLEVAQDRALLEDVISTTAPAQRARARRM